jgi:hypothetical protein
MRLFAPLMAAALLLPPASADAQDRRYDRDRHDRWEERRENRRDARRTSIIAGAVAAGVTSAAKKNEAERRYEECLLDTGYDQYCEERLDYEKREARRAGRRASVVAGGAAYAIVRD